MTMALTNDNRKLTPKSGSNMRSLVLAVVALGWWQCATISIAPPAYAATQQAAPSATPASAGAPAAQAAATAPPLLPGQVGANYDEAIRYATAAMQRKMYQMAADNF